MFKLVVILVLIAIGIQFQVQGGAVKTKKFASVDVVHSGNNAIQLKVSTGNGDGDNYHLNLKKPESSIFSPDFKFLVMDVNENGETEIHDKTPSATELGKAEEHFYQTSDSFSEPLAFVTVHKDETTGTYRVTGFIDGHEISHHSENKHILTLTEPVQREIHSENARINDYVDLGRNMTDSRDVRINDYIDLGRNNTDIDLPMTRQSVTAQPEVTILFDYANYQLFGGNTNNINWYLAVFYRAVNNRYATIQDASIVVTVSGVFSFNSRAAQPFMEQSLIPDKSAYDMNMVLDKLSYWVYQNKATLPKFDVAMLLSGENFKSKDSSGNYVSGIAGLAYIGGACWITSTQCLGTSVNADQGGFWNGVMTASHELAHNLNAPHDGDSTASSCPWSQGYIMSYEGWGTKNKFYFSSCSQNLIKSFIGSTNGACLKAWSASTVWGPVSSSPGDLLDMTAQCQKHLNRSDAVVETANRTPNDMCLNLKCRVPNGGGSYLIYTMNRVPGDNSPCGTNMVCRNGDCVAK